VQPELPFLAAGGVALIGGAVAEKKWPSNALTAIIGTVVLVLLASATTNTRLAPLVRAIGLLLLTVSIMAAIKTVQDSKKPKKAK
jgi:peptidoglycan/LPS O-acetylase OafA/YrhL